MSSPVRGVAGRAQTIEIAGAMLACTLVPLSAVVFWPPLASPFFAAKRAVLVLLAGLIGATAIVRLSKNLVVAPRDFRWPNCYFVASVFLFVSAACISAAVSPLRYMASPGLVWILAAVMLALGLPILIARRERYLIKTVALSGSLIAIIAVLQAFGLLDLFGLFGRSTLLTGRMRIYGTVGNPNFVGAFLAGTVPASLLLARTSKSPAQSKLAISSAIIACIATVLTGSRAGLTALVVALLAFVWMGTDNRRAQVGVTISLIFMAALLFVSTTMNERTVGTAMRGRAFIWRATLSDSTQWLTGAGPNTFAYLYLTRAGKQVQSNATTVRFVSHETRAHNEIVEVWSEFGLLGCMALLLGTAAWLRIAISTLRRGTDRPVVAAALAGVAALAVTSMFDFPLHRAEGLALLCAWLALPLAQVVDIEPRAVSRAGSLLAFLGASACVVVAGWFAVCPLYADALVGTGQQLENKGKPGEASSAYSGALRLDPLSGNAHFNLVRSLAAEGRLIEALSQSQQLVRYVNEPECWILRSRIYRRLRNPAAAALEIRAAAKAFPFSNELQQELEELEHEVQSASSQ